MKKNKISKNWVNKQRRDIYVRQSKVDGYRARSVYKLIEIDEKFKIFKNGISIIDLGAAPGSWSQYCSKKIKNGKAVNLSSGKFLCFIDLAKIILKKLGKNNIRVVGNSNKPEGVFARGGSTNLQKKLGFTPKISISKGIDMALEYFMKNSL